ncbi:hypothetical protein AYI69_g3981 [Smittium culicis]|uniref:Uncharacterized protein n=1 Tax=Smittium culicis TaxID=133412 RepID=A0A1R1YHZ4_9FUNG|nr:hypothetical protein AYI69_g3981 [Smittium culicis]
MPNFENLIKEAASTNLLYDSSSIWASGWTAKNLDFINNRKFDSNEIICRNCAAIDTNGLEISAIPGFGKCIGGFCEFKSSECYFNVQKKYWWKCIPDEFNEKSLTNNEKQLAKNDELCDNTKSIVPFSVISSPGANKYNNKNRIFLPCTADGFDINLDVESQDDLYFILSDKDSFSPSDSVFEIALRFRDEQYDFNEGVVSQATSGSQSPDASRAFKGRIRVNYTGNVLGVYIDGEGLPAYIVGKKSYKNLYIASHSGKLDVKSGFLDCQKVAACQPSGDLTPIATSAAQPTATSANSATSIPNDSCNNKVGNFADFTVSSSKYKVRYDTDNKFHVDCNAEGFDLKFDADTQDDLYFFLPVDTAGASTVTALEVALKFADNEFKIVEGSIKFEGNNTSHTPLSTHAFNGRFRVMYNGYFLNFYVNGVNKISYAIENMKIKYLLVAPYQGTLQVSNGSLNCYSNNCQSSDSQAAASATQPSTTSATHPSATQVASLSSSSISISLSTSSSLIPVSSKVCDSYSSSFDYSVVSSPYIKMYDLSRPILVPCSGSDFQLDFDVDSESDLYVSFTDLTGFYSSSGYTESYFGFSSGNYDINRFTSNGNINVTTSVTQPKYSGHLKITFKNGILSLYESDEFEVSYRVKNLDLKHVFISPYTGAAKISNGIFTCSSVIVC